MPGAIDVISISEFNSGDNVRCSGSWCPVCLNEPETNKKFIVCHSNQLHRPVFVWRPQQTLLFKGQYATVYAFLGMNWTFKN